MRPAVFIDTNIPIYAAGGDHPLKAPCARILHSVAEDPRLFVTDSEAFQELLHRYLALGRWELGREVIRTFAEAMHGRVEPVYVKGVLAASGLADHQSSVSARDLVHAAVMQRIGTSRLFSVLMGLLIWVSRSSRVGWVLLRNSLATEGCLWFCTSADSRSSCSWLQVSQVGVPVNLPAVGRSRGAIRESQCPTEVSITNVLASILYVEIPAFVSGGGDTIACYGGVADAAECLGPPR